jgi:hypothetical protein
MTSRIVTRRWCLSRSLPAALGTTIMGTFPERIAKTLVPPYNGDRLKLVAAIAVVTSPSLLAALTVKTCVPSAEVSTKWSARGVASRPDRRYVQPHVI